MITTKTMYELHNLELKTKLEETDKELQDLEVIKDKLAEYFISLPFKHISKEDISTGNIDLLPNPSLSSQKLFNVNVRRYKTVLQFYNNKLEQKKVLVKLKLKPHVFSFILGRFNILLYKKLIYNSYEFKHLYIGGLYVICNKNKPTAIDWGKSTKNKEELLRKGEIPYTKQEAEKALEEGREYKGKAWLEFLPPYSLFFQWSLTNANFIRLPNIKNFTFVPLRGRDSCTIELGRHRRTLTDEECINTYNKPSNAN